MIAAFLTGQPTPVVHAVYEVAKGGFVTVMAMGYCGEKADAGKGTYQIPDWAFDGRKTFVTATSQAWSVCEKCMTFVRHLEIPR